MEERHETRELASPSQRIQPHSGKYRGPMQPFVCSRTTMETCHRLGFAPRHARARGMIKPVSKTTARNRKTGLGCRRASGEHAQAQDFCHVFCTSAGLPIEMRESRCRAHRRGRSGCANQGAIVRGAELIPPGGPVQRAYVIRGQPR